MSADGDAPLAPLPKRVLEGPDDAEGGAAGIDPLPFVDELLERANVLLATLTSDVSHLREDQQAEILRIEAEHERKEAAAAEAAEVLERFLAEAREVAQRRGKADLLAKGMKAKIDPRNVRPLPDIVRHLEQELKAAQGITAAIRLEAIGTLVLEAHFRVELLKREAEQTKASLIAETERDLDKESTEAAASFEIGMDLLQRDLGVLEAAMPVGARSWADEGWATWQPPTVPSTLVRLGHLTRPGMRPDVGIPALLDVATSPGLVLDGGDLRDASLGAVRSLVVRLLGSVPPGGLQLTLVDPTGLGSSFGPFLQLAEHDAALVDGGVATLEGDIDAAMNRLAGHVERVIRQYLRGRYATLAECNAAAGEVLEPLRALIVADFPAGFSPEAQQLLTRLVEQGPQAGLITLMVRDPSVKTRRSRSAGRTALPPTLERLAIDGGALAVEHPTAGRWSLVPDAVPAGPGEQGPSPAVVDRILVATGESSRMAGHGTVDVQTTWRLLDDALKEAIRLDLPARRGSLDPATPATWWGGVVAPRLAVPIGRSGALDVATFVLDSDERGCAVLAGDPGSGLSTLLTTVVAGLSMLYRPDACELHLVSLAERATFTSAATSGLPHAKLVADNAERELALAVLDRLAERIEAARAAGADDEGDGPEVRVVVVLDGAEQLMATEDADARRAVSLLETIIQSGPEVGVHLVLAVRTAPAGAEEEDPAVERLLERLPLDAVGTRVVLRTGPDVASRLVGSMDDSSDDLPTKPGDAVIATGLSGSGARAARLTNTSAKDRYRFLRALREHATDQGIAARPQIHDGTAAARLELSPLHRLLMNADQRDQRRTPRLWLGEPATLGDPVEVQLRRQDGANLLVVSEDGDAAAGMVLAGLTSMVLVHGATAAVRVLDFTPLESGVTEGVQAFAEHWPVTVDRRRNLLKVLDAVHREVQDRLASGTYDHHPLVLVLAGVDRARDLDPEAHAADEPDPVRVVEAVLRDGPDVGVHTVVWSSSLEAVERRLGRAALREFALRVVTSLDEDDSLALIDSAAAASLRPNQALLHDEDWGRLVRFRPYLPPPASGFSNTAAGVSGEGR